MRPHRIWSSQAPGICKWRTLAANEWSSLPGTSKRATNSERSYCPQVNQLTNQSNLLLKCSDRPSHLIRCVENEFASFGFNLCPSQAFHLVFETLWKSSIYPHFRKKLNRWLVNFKNELGQCSTQFHTNEDLWIAYHVRPDTSIIVINHHNWRGLKHLISLTLVQTPLPQYFQTLWPYPQSSHVQKISFYQLWDASRESSSNQFQLWCSAKCNGETFQRFQPGLGATSLSYSSSIRWASCGHRGFCLARHNKWRVSPVGFGYVHLLFEHQTIFQDIYIIQYIKNIP